MRISILLQGLLESLQLSAIGRVAGSPRQVASRGGGLFSGRGRGQERAWGAPTFFFLAFQRRVCKVFSSSLFDTLSNMLSRAFGDLFAPFSDPLPGAKVVISLRTSFKNRLLHRIIFGTVFQALREASGAIFGPPWDPLGTQVGAHSSPSAPPCEPISV